MFREYTFRNTEKYDIGPDFKSRVVNYLETHCFVCVVVTWTRCWLAVVLQSNASAYGKQLSAFTDDANSFFLASSRPRARSSFSCLSLSFRTAKYLFFLRNSAAEKYFIVGWAPSLSIRPVAFVTTIWNTVVLIRIRFFFQQPFF